ncbi:MAG: DUF6377 domain-containing protein [Bacteroidales bacterium]
MKKQLILFSLYILSSPLIAQGGLPEHLRNDLEKTISNNQEYVHKREHRITVLKDLSDKSVTDSEHYRINKELTNEYRAYKSDSALTYALQALALAKRIGNYDLEVEATLTLASIYNVSGMYKESSDLLKQIHPDTLPLSLKQAYLGVYAELYRYMASFAKDGKMKLLYDNKRMAYQDSLIAVSDPTDLNTVLVKADRLVDENKINDAIQLVLQSQSKLSPDDRSFALTSYSLANAYGKLGNKEKQKEYLALSALSDIKNAVKENMSLSTLALQLYEEGHLNEAYNYIRFALDDALISDAKLRSIEILRILPMIDNAYKQNAERQAKIQRIFFIIVSVLALVLVFLFLFILRQKRKLQYANNRIHEINDQLNNLNNDLKETNSKVSDANLKLAQANQIQGEYIAKYLKLCSQYIGKIDDYRRMLLKKATGTTDTPKEILQLLKSKDIVDEELKSFYVDFDKAFLDLYPDFVEQFNNLLQDDEQIELKPGELLNTEIRIFALIRLGINESSQIAEFLRYSVTTIYNYRTKMRNKARGVRDDFEKEVLLIDSVL